MRDREEIQEILNYLQTTEERTLNFNEELIVAAYQKKNDNHSLPVKILSVFGGLLGSLAFLGFLFVSGLYDSGGGLMILGILCITGAIAVNKAYDKIIIDTVSVSFFIIGYILIGFGSGELHIDRNIICIIFIVIALCSLSIVQRYILSFIAVLVMNGSIVALILFNDAYSLFHVYIAALVLIITYLFLKEVQVIKAGNALSRLYSPVRTGCVFSFLLGLALPGKKGIFDLSYNHIWLSSIMIIAAIVFIISLLFDVLSITKAWHKAIIYICGILLLAPTALSPAISGSILVMLLSFLVNYKTGLVLGIIAFIYFIIQYYYDLHFTLLNKSIFLLSSGVLFIALYFFTHKKLTANEEI